MSKRAERSKRAEKFIQEYSDWLSKGNITPELCNRYNVKRGLRNQDGTGVLVGLTEIGSVHGYIVDEGEKIPVRGDLRYRGIGIKDLVAGFQSEKRFGFEETTYLLLFGYLPNQEQLEEFNEILGSFRKLPPHFTEDSILKNPSNNIMNKLARSVLVTYSYDDNPEDMSVPNNLRQCVEFIARFPTMVSSCYLANHHYYDGKSLFIHTPLPNLSTAENFLLMIRPDKKYTQQEAEILDLMLVLHAEHGGGNNSAFTTHVVSSSGTDVYSAICAAVGSLKGPLHGGANIKVHIMMDDIKQNVKDWTNEEEVKDYLTKILKKETFDGKGLIYGMGHAVYTLSDPRAELLKEKARELAEAAGKQNEFNLYTVIERLTPQLFKEIKNNDKPLCANVDFYSGFVYSTLGISPDLYTPIFAVSRITGWCAHRVEEIVNGKRIMRPAYKNVSKAASYIPMSDR
jgi:citrate synthase